MKQISPKSSKKQVKKNWPKKYDWEALRLEFLVSPIAEVAERWRQKWGDSEVPKNWNFQKQTKGRAEEKKQLREEVTKQAMEELKKEMVEAYKPSSEELSEAHKKIFTLIQATINSMMERLENGEVSLDNIKTIKSLREIIKIEKWEPTKYVQQDTKATITSWEVPTDEELEKIQSLLSSAQ